MKTKLLLPLILFASISLSAQQNIWTGTIDDKWSDENNWTGTVPTASDDVLIPSGFVVTIDTPANILSIEVQGNSVLNVTSSLVIANPSEFEDNVVVNWVSGDLGGGGTLLNSGTINMSYFSFDLSGSTELNNPGTINMVGGAIGISSDSVLNNSGTGIIDFQTNGSQFGASSGDLINQGTIKTSFPNPTDQGIIACDIINQDGIFQIDTGTLNLNNTDVNLMGAEFNVSAGATLNLNSPMTVLGILSGIVFGDLNWNGDIFVTSTAVFNFSGNNIINWVNGDLDGGGTLTNLSIMDKNGGGVPAVKNATTIENEGEIRFSSGSDITLIGGSIINNNVAGLIDIRTNGAEIRSSGSTPNLLNNSGLIKTSFPNTNDASIIWAQLNDLGGTIQVEAGTLSLNNAGTTLANTVINIAAASQLQWLMPIAVSGSLTGVNDGTIIWDDPLIVNSSAAFNFSGSGDVNWKSGNLEGGGTLTNYSTLTKSLGISSSILGSTTLNNESLLQLTGASDIFIGTGSTINNNPTGTIIFDSTGSAIGTNGIAPNVLNNFGLIRRDVSASFPTISATVNNYGTIEAASNSFIFSGVLNNDVAGIIKGTGVIELPSAGNFTNNGAFGPGASPGTLTIVGDYPSTTNSILEIELDGLIQGTEHDVLAIDGNADLEGDLDVILGFAPQIGDEFVILTTTNTINNCNLPNTVTSSFGGVTYEFNVVCRNNNELVLVTQGVLSVDTYDDDLSSARLYPNPTTDLVSFSNKTITRIEVFDLTGKRIKQASSYSISLRGLESGVYIIKGSNDLNRSVSVKLIKVDF